MEDIKHAVVLIVLLGTNRIKKILGLKPREKYGMGSRRRGNENKMKNGKEKRLGKHSGLTGTSKWAVWDINGKKLCGFYIMLEIFEIKEVTSCWKFSSDEEINSSRILVRCLLKRHHLKER